jgi:Ca2+/Na+ antiporter
MDLAVLTSFIIFTIIELILLKKFIAIREKTAKKSVIASLAFLWLVFIISYIFKFSMPLIS